MTLVLRYAISVAAGACWMVGIVVYLMYWQEKRMSIGRTLTAQEERRILDTQVVAFLWWALAGLLTVASSTIALLPG